MSKRELSDALVEAAVAQLVADDDEWEAAAVEADRILREFARRHRSDAVLGCACRLCCATYRPLEA
jgi:hypothetical protein